MTGIVRQPSPGSILESSDQRPVESTVASGIELVVRETRRDPQGTGARVSGHLLLHRAARLDRGVVSLVQVDESDGRRETTTWAQAAVEGPDDGSDHGRVDYSLELRRRLTPPFRTEAGVRWWAVRLDAVGVGSAPIMHRLEVPSVRRVVAVEGAVPRNSDATDWLRLLPPRCRPRGYALRCAATAGGQVSVKSRGDWGVIETPRDDSAPWVATIVGYELAERSSGAAVSVSTITRTNLVAGPNTVEFEVPAGFPPTHRGPLLATWYELRVHTADQRRLGARHAVMVMS